MRSNLLCQITFALFAVAYASGQPHILMILADDFGWGDSDWHKQKDWDELATPHMLELIKDGIELDRHYAFKFCSPSRSAIQSGRNPVNVNVQNLDPVMVNDSDPVSGFMGIPRNMTGMGSVMKKAGYATVFAGKWDVGMATEDHTPKGRGYDSSMLYFKHDNDYWTSYSNPSDDVEGSTGCPGQPLFTDLWKDSAPAWGLNNSGACWVPSSGFPIVKRRTEENCPAYPSISGCRYEDEIFAEFVLDAIQTHNLGQPLFIFWATHVVHGPLQVPKIFLDLYNHVDDWRRRRYLAMTRFLDSAVERVTKMLKTRGMWDNTLIVFSADNGGPIYARGDAGASNYPLRGGKGSNWEGGVRVNAWVSGGFVPTAMRGQKLDGLTAVWDWYATFAFLGGVDPTDHRAQVANLPPIDSLNLWPYLSGVDARPPRTFLPLGASTCRFPSQANCTNFWGEGTNTTTMVDSLIEDLRPDGGLWKLVLGRQSETGWQGPRYPNASTSEWNSSASIFDCGSGGCLYRIDLDPSEHNDLYNEEPARAKAMKARIQQLNVSTFSPNRGVEQLSRACSVAKDRYRGFWGPFVDIAEPSDNSLNVMI